WAASGDTRRSGTPRPGTATSPDRRWGGSTAAGAAHARGGHRAGREAGGTDVLAAALAPAVAALRQLPHGRIDLRELLTGLVEQGGHVLPLKGDRRAFRIVLIVGPGRVRRLDDPAKLALQPIEPLEGGCPFRGQQLERARLLSHPSWVPAGDRCAFRVSAFRRPPRGRWRSTCTWWRPPGCRSTGTGGTSWWGAGRRRRRGRAGSCRRGTGRR